MKYFVIIAVIIFFIGCGNNNNNNSKEINVTLKNILPPKLPANL